MPQKQLEIPVPIRGWPHQDYGDKKSFVFITDIKITERKFPLQKLNKSILYLF